MLSGTLKIPAILCINAYVYKYIHTYRVIVNNELLYFADPMPMIRIGQTFIQ